MKKQLFILLFLATLCSCDYSIKQKFFWQEENATVFNDSLTFVSNGIKYIPINSKTSVSSIPYLNILTLSGVEYLYFYNHYSNQLFIYHFSSDSLIKTITFDSQGPNELLPNTTNQVLLTSLDTIITYDTATKRISFFKDSVLFNRINLYQITDGKTLNTYKVWQPSLMEGFIKRGNNLYFTLHQYLSYALFNCSGNCNYNTVLAVNITNKDAAGKLPVPKIYSYGNWGVQTAIPTHLFHTHNANQRKFVYSFAADPYLYIEENDGYSKIFVGSKYFKKIYPMMLRKRNVDKEKSWKHCATSPFYGRVFYDQYNDLYYRFTTHGVSNDEYDKGTKSGPFSIIILNEKFEKVGEVYFDKNCADNYSLKHIVLCKKGFFILRNDVYNNHPDSIPLEHFTISKLASPKQTE